MLKIKANKKKLIWLVLVVIFVAGFFSFKADFSVQAQSTGFGLEQIEEVTLLGAEDIRLTIAKIIRVILGFLGIIALAIMLYGGYIYMTAGGNEQKVATAKKIIINGAIGLAIILSAFAITQFVLNKLAEATGFGAGTISPNCADLDYAAANPKECTIGTFNPCSNLYNQFVVKSITPSMPSGDPIGMNNFAIRTVFSQGLDPAITAAEAFIIERGGADVSGEFTYQFIDSPNNSVVEAASSGFLVGTAPDGVYAVTVQSTLTSDSGGGLLEETACGSFPTNAAFDIDTTGVLDTQDPVVDAITYNGLSYGGTIALPRGRIYEIGTAIIDNSGAGYVHLEIQRKRSSDDTTISGPIVFYDGPRVARGSQAPLADPYNFNYSLLIASNNTLYNDESEGNEPSYYEVVLTATDIDHNATTVISTFIVVESSCQFGTGEGSDPGCRGNGECTTDAECLSGVCDEDTGQCLAVPLITDVSPLESAGGSWITIIGQFFGSEEGVIEFGIDTTADGEPDTWIPAALADCGTEDIWHNNWVVVAVPLDPALPDGSLSTIRLRHESFDIVDNPDFFDTTRNDRGPILDFFTRNDSLSRPGLCALVPDKGLPEDPIIVLGQDLGAAGAGSSLTFGGIQAPISLWDPSGTQINTNVPSNMQLGTVGVLVIVDGDSSNGIPFIVMSEDQFQTPIIESITPENITRGSYVTIAGRRFGENPGRVYLAPDIDLITDLPLACGDTWNSKQIIAQIPDSVLVDQFVVIVANEAGLQSVPGEADRLNVVAGGPMPSICALSPTSGSAPLPDSDPELTITGINFSADPIADPTIYFWGMDSDVADNATWLSRAGDPGVSGDVEIMTTRIPVDSSLYSFQSIPLVSDSGFSMQTGPIKVAASGQESNSVTYSVDDCRQIPDTRWPAGMRCCSEGPSEGVFIQEDYVCPGEIRTGGYVWRFTTGKIPTLPKVLEQCSSDVPPPFLPSPTPWQSYDDGENVCLNRTISVEFSMEMDEASFEDKVRMYTCGIDDLTADPSIIFDKPDCKDEKADIIEITADYISGGTLIIRDPRDPPDGFGNLLSNTWYHVELLEGILGIKWIDVLGSSQLTYPPLLRTRPCGEGTAFCFDFKTGPEGSKCVLTSVGIKPPQYTVDYLGPVLNSNSKDPLQYMLWGSGDQSCSILPVKGLGWNWITDLPLFATVSQIGSAGTENDIFATAKALQEPPGNVVEIEASTSTAAAALLAKSDLYINLGPPRIIEYWPNCSEACANATIGARFNRQMVHGAIPLPEGLAEGSTDFSVYENGIHLYKCANENTCINAIANFSTSTGILDMAGLAVVPFNILPSSNREVVRLAPSFISQIIVSGAQAI